MPELNKHERALAQTRRLFLASTALGGTAALAGCSGGGGGGGGDTETETDSGSGSGDTDTETDTETATESGSGGSGTGSLELAHWWTPESANAAIQSVLEGFSEQHPEYEISAQAIAGGAGDALQTEVRQRILNNDPPSTMQWWPGAALMPFIEAGVLRDIGESVWSQNDMQDAYLEGPMNAARPGPDDTFVTVPINIHRINNLFYSIPVVEDAGVDPSSVGSPSELVEVLGQIDDAGYVALPHQTAQPWPTLQLWANVFLGLYDAEMYADVTTNGNISNYESEVKEALGIVADMGQYFPEDAASLDWPQAQSYLIREEGAFQQQGDWAAGNLIANDEMEFQTDWDMVPFPGTEGMYQLNMDSFPFPEPNPSPQVTRDFLRYVGTAEAQRRFNPLKGSIPPRSDVSTEPFNPFLQRQIEDFTNSDVQPVSTAHGLSVPPGGLSDLQSATADFIGPWNVDQTYSRYVDAIEGN
jgi:glucose/mannose transport system substrate-binding protein